jgi:hypothetical protein
LVIGLDYGTTYTGEPEEMRDVVSQLTMK